MADTYTLSGIVFDVDTGEPIADLRIETWDLEHIIHDPISSTHTNHAGFFEFVYTNAFLEQRFEGRLPSLYFKIFSGGTLIASTEETVTWTRDNGNFTVEIPVQWQEGMTTYTIAGYVSDAATGNPISDLRIEPWDLDHVINNPISSASTNADGFFQFEYTSVFLEELFQGRVPSLYFKIFLEGTLIANTEGTVTWTIDDGNVTVDISVELEEPMTTYIISGYVSDAATGAPIANLNVQTWDLGFIINNAISNATTGANGFFQFTYTNVYLEELFQGRTPSLYFKILSEGNLVASTQATVTWTIHDGNVTLEIPVEWSQPEPEPVTPRPCDESDANNFTIAGVVSSQERADLRNLQVQIVDKGVGNDFVLQQTNTDKCGNFWATFPSAAVAARGKTLPDVQAKVYINGQFLAASEVAYNATGNETLEVVIPTGSMLLPSEHQSLTSALTTHYSGALRDLQETDSRHDITYLANKSGWDARMVALAALADQFSAQSAAAGSNLAIAAPYFYALFRAGFSANEDTLYRADAETIKNIWSNAAQQGIIPSLTESDITAMAQRFKGLSAGKLLNGTPITGVSAMSSMLQIAGLSEPQKQQFARLLTDHRTDMPAFWNAVTTTFGATTSNRLQADGKLAYLTVNNAPLMAAVRGSIGAGVTDMVELAKAGYHSASQWATLLGGTIPVPDEIPGEDEEEKRSNYAEYLAAQVGASYPTASVSQMVASGALPISSQSDVRTFLNAHQSNFEIGAQPVEQFITDNNLTVAPAVVTQVKRIQRVYQIAPTYEVMGAMIENGLESAAQVVRYDREEFVEGFSEQLGGAANAEKVHEHATQVHNVVLNLVISYLTAQNGIPLGSQQLGAPANGLGPVLRPAPMGAGSVSIPGSGSVIAYPTLESLFGEMDFCDCEHCRSILSPAAYLVDLLKFIDRGTSGPANPLDVLLLRRPDIQHLPLTCENTNTALPYIDVVNETLEYFITHSLSLAGYPGRDTGTMKSEDLLATPAFVIDTAYGILAGQNFPLPLPFHRPLEGLRRHFEKFDVMLPLAMEKIRRSNALDRGSNPYGWRDILMEELRLSRDEYKILTDSAAVPFWEMYGFPNGTSTTNVIAGLSNAKAFCRRLDISYDDLVAIVQTRFVNPDSDLLPKLQRLSVSFSVMKQLKTGAINDGQFNALLPTGALAPSTAEYGGNIPAWVKDNTNYNRIMSLITLADVTLQPDPCSFDTLELRRAEPMANVSDTSTRLGVADFIRILRFIRIWKKLEWTIEQTDAALCALFRGDLTPLSAADTDTAGELDIKFPDLLLRLGIVVRMMRTLNLTPKRDLQSLLVLWSNIDTHGPNALYRQMFLNPTILTDSLVYADNGYGAFFTDSSKKIIAHKESLRAAFNLTGEEFDQIIAALGIGAGISMNLPDISKIFRHGYLARVLRISVRELLMLITITGLDPFNAAIVSDPFVPPLLQFMELLNELKERSLKLSTALYLVWNQDLSGQAAPGTAQMNEFARGLRSDFSKIENEFSISDDPDGEIARARITLVYGTEATDIFFNILNETFTSQTFYTHFAPSFGTALAAAVKIAGGTFGASATPRISYDEFHRQLVFTGVLDTTKRDALKAVVTALDVVAEVPGGQLAMFQADFRNAIDRLYAANSTTIGQFFARYDELRQLYLSFLPADPPATRRSALLGMFLPTLISRRKTQLALQRLADAAKVNREFAERMVNASPASTGLHAAGSSTRPALDDLRALETRGLSVQFYDGAVIGSNPHPLVIETNLAYAAASGHTLPANITSPGNAVSGVWSGNIEAPEGGEYNFIITAQVGASVALKIDGNNVALAASGGVWKTAAPMTLKAGTLYTFELTAQNIQNTLKIQWETLGRGRAVIPAGALYPSSLMATARLAYIRFLKGAALAGALGLTAAEVARPELTAVSWLNALPVTGNAVTPSALLAPFRELLDYAYLKKAFFVSDESLLNVVRALGATSPDTAPLYKLTGWNATATDQLATHFGGTVPGMKVPGLFRRVYDAFTLAQKMGIPGSALIAATTNTPTASTVRDLQLALRARYSADDWRTVVQPINDQMRRLQRDALVAYVLHQFRSNTLTQHINTTEKLFEYFLMDVAMEPCMQTSRIRHAISSVQLYIERCIMNLEPGISPALLSAKQWEWMKRYRVWEANRKVFLFPENWLEPELRDDKSPFFRELESELLQSDITEDSASIAILNYLSRLEEVAKLEPCSLYHIAGADRTANIDHVVARTTGANRKYYYRRREYGYWTPWEQIKLDVEDNPVVPVVWRDRLLLFWVRLLKTGPDSTKGLKPTGGGTLDTMTLPPEPQQRVKAILCWSEFYNGKWQPAKSTNPELPAEITQFKISSSSPFDRSHIAIDVEEEGDGLKVTIGHGAAYLFYNTHGEPMAGAPPYSPMCVPGRRERWMFGGKNNFSIDYWGPGCGPAMTRNVLKPDLPYRLVETHHPVPDVWHPPFFYYDARHVFYVSSTQEEVPLRAVRGYGIPTTTSGAAATPPMVTGRAAPASIAPGWAAGGMLGSTARTVDTGAAQIFVSEDANIKQAFGSTRLVQYDGMQIGPAGAVDSQG